MNFICFCLHADFQGHIVMSLFQTRFWSKKLALYKVLSACYPEKQSGKVGR